MTCLGVAGVAALLLMLVVGGAWANVFLHNPRGSNNRLNEETTDRANANRMFDSQVPPTHVLDVPVTIMFIFTAIVLLMEK